MVLRKHPPRRITDLFVKHAKVRPGESRSEYFDPTLPGFALRVTSTGHKSYTAFYRLGGRLRRFTIGSTAKYKLADARRKAREAFQAADEGMDLAAHKRASRRRATPLPRSFEVQAREFIKRHVEGQRSAKETKASIERDLIGAWSGRIVTDIGKADVIELLDGFQDAGHHRARNRRLQIVRRFYNWLIERGITESNPAAGIKKLAETRRRRVLSDDELRAIWRAAEGIGYPGGDFVRLLMLTAVRRDEAATVEKADVDLEARAWVIPPAKFKADRAHLMPLADETLALFETMPKFGGPFLLTTTGGKRPIGGFADIKTSIDAASGVSGWVFHDIRRSVRTRLSALGVNADVAELCLGHRVGGAIRQTYDVHQFHDERRAAFDLWARTLRSIIDNRTGENIVAIIRRP
jgi:integrase